MNISINFELGFRNENLFLTWTIKRWTIAEPWNQMTGDWLTNAAALIIQIHIIQCRIFTS